MSGRNQADLLSVSIQNMRIPVHGEFKHRKAQAGVAAELGMDK